MIPAQSLYLGRVMHMRLQPRVHQFRYRVFSLLLDIDRLAETLRSLRLVGLNKWGVLSFYDSDHGARDGSPLRGWVDAQLAAEQIERPEQVFLLAIKLPMSFAQTLPRRSTIRRPRACMSRRSLRWSRPIASRLGRRASVLRFGLSKPGWVERR